MRHNKYNWSELSKQRKGRFAEYFTCMELSAEGIDVYKAEVDDRGIDFVIRLTTREQITHFDLQVKSITPPNLLFLVKRSFKPRDRFMLALVLFNKNGRLPSLFLVPSLDVLANPSLFRFKDEDRYELEPEWHLNLTRANIIRLEKDFNHIKILEKLFLGER